MADPRNAKIGKQLKIGDKVGDKYYAGTDYGLQTEGSYKKLQDAEYFAPFERTLTKLNKAAEPINNAIGIGANAFYQAFIEPYQGELQKQIVGTTLSGLDAGNKALTGLIDENTELGPNGSGLASNLLIDSAAANLGKVGGGAKLATKAAKNINKARRLAALQNLGQVGYNAGIQLPDLKHLKDIIFDFKGLSPAVAKGEKLRSQRLWELLQERARLEATEQAAKNGQKQDIRSAVNRIDRNLSIVALTPIENIGDTLSKQTKSVYDLINNVERNTENFFRSQKVGITDRVHHDGQLVLPAKHVVAQRPAVRSDAINKSAEVKNQHFGDQPAAVSSQPYEVHKQSHTNPETGKVDWGGNWITQQTGEALPPGSSFDDVYNTLSNTSELSVNATRQAMQSPQMTKHTQDLVDTMTPKVTSELGINFQPYAVDLTPTEKKIWRSHMNNLPKEIKQRFSPHNKAIQLLNVNPNSLF
jgi:hypothetical protein